MNNLTSTIMSDNDKLPEVISFIDSLVLLWNSNQDFSGVLNINNHSWVKFCLLLGLDIKQIPTYIISEQSQIFKILTTNKENIDTSIECGEAELLHKGEKYFYKKCSSRKSQFFFNEVAILNLLNINCITVHQDDCAYILMEFFEAKNLHSAYKDFVKLDSEKQLKLMLTLIKHLKIIHALNIVHIDIKLSNILFFEDKLQLIDFNISRLLLNLDKIDKFFIDSPKQIYQAPEIKINSKNKIYSHKADIYSLGVVMKKVGIPEISACLDMVVQSCLHDEPISRPSLRYIEEKIKDELRVYDGNNEDVNNYGKCDFCHQVSMSSKGCIICGLDAEDTFCEASGSDWVGEDLVYLGVTDAIHCIISNIHSLKINQIERLDTYITVAGGGSWLHYLSVLDPKEITIFDKNPYALQYVKLMIELIDMADDIYEFISFIYCKDLQIFINKYGDLSFDNQFIYLSQGYENRFYKKIQSKISQENFELYLKFIRPFHYSQNVRHSNRTRNLLPCWETDLMNPPVSNSGVGYLHAGRLKGRFFPSTASLYYGYGWLENADTFLDVKNKLNSAKVSFLTSSSEEIIKDISKKPSLSIICHFSNIYDDFLLHDKLSLSEKFTSLEFKFGNIFLAYLNTKSGLNVLRDNRNLNDKYNYIYTRGDFSYFKHSKFANIYTRIAEIIYQLKETSVLDIACWDGDLYQVLNGIDRYVGLEISDNALNKFEIKEEVDTSLVCGNIEELLVPREKFGVIYFGGIFCYYRDDIELLLKYVRKYNPNYIIIQESCSYDLTRFCALMECERISLIGDEIIDTKLHEYYDFNKSAVIGDERRIFTFKCNEQSASSKLSNNLLSVILKVHDGIISDSMQQVLSLVDEIIIVTSIEFQDKITQNLIKQQDKLKFWNVAQELLNVHLLEQAFNETKCKYVCLLESNYIVEGDFAKVKKMLIHQAVTQGYFNIYNKTDNVMETRVLLYQVSSDGNINFAPSADSLRIDCEIFYQPISCQEISNQRECSYMVAQLAYNQSRYFFIDQAKLYFANKMYDKAVACLENRLYIEDSRQMAEGYFYLAQCLNKQGSNNLEIVTTYKKSLECGVYLETLVAIADCYRKESKKDVGYIYAKASSEILDINNKSFGNFYMITYWRWVMLSVTAWKKDYNLGLYASKQALKSNFSCAQDEKNLDYYKKARW